MKHERNHFDLSHYSVNCGKMGMLQTLSVIPVLAGDSIEIRMNSINRLSPLRRSLSVDAQVDTFAFYVPHRHVYTEANGIADPNTDSSDTWTNLVQQGVDSTVTLPTYTTGNNQPVWYLGNYIGGDYEVPLWSVAGYNQIYNRYFRYLKLTETLIPDSYTCGSGVPTGNSTLTTKITSGDQQFYGFLCARLKTPWTTGIVDNLDDDDKEVASIATLDILDLELVKRRYETELEREYFNIRYTDIMKGDWGHGVNTDADQRPTLLHRQTNHLGGHDIDATADANLGTFSGKSMGKGGFSMPRKFIPEHGAIWIMQLVRFPTLMFYEAHPLHNATVPSYTEIVADYDTVLGVAPDDLDFTDWNGTNTSGSTLNVPFGQGYRYQPSHIHFKYSTLAGYPFNFPATFASNVNSVYCTSTEHDDVFSTLQLGHWQNQSHIKCNVSRIFPSTRESIRVGI